MATSVFLLNRTRVEIDAAPATPVLDLIRRHWRLTGCKEACREGDCGACLVLLGKREQALMTYQPATACLLPLGAVAGRHLVTIEGLNAEQLNPLQQALVDCGAIQCGFCTPGLVVALTAFFLNSPRSDADAAIDAVAGNLCRCTGYSGIKRAIHRLCAQFDLTDSTPENRINDCIEWRLLPDYFAHIARQLAAMTDAAEDQQAQALLVGGGTDLFVRQADGLSGRTLRFLPSAGNRDCARMDGQQCRIDAMANIEQLRASPLLQSLLPSIARDLTLLCSAPIRQHATLGGNLANASPIGDLSVFFLALDASVRLGIDNSRRGIRLRDFFGGYKQTACRAGEQLLEISFDCPAPAVRFSFEKVSKRTFLDIASVNSAMSIRLLDDGRIDTVHLSAGGVAPIPLYLSATCDYLRGKPISADSVREAAAIAQNEISPICDLRGSVAYKRLLLRQLIYAHFLKLFPDLLVWEALHATG
ncbi:FAD binding domain-containing protein [Methylomonas sp. LL1]|uniref:2Fe-2S iron-sulfur cluster-binding protein n=1 Tax=Methylomonas sp. LL1 TaxID=2785785 RepID=UPI0018C3D8AA|nr:2Fe-2S iron-sulfur cluster-binding protein [Methylomonas sp. LL1]QPK65028.1 FAD binding domain-containing protein [Methylomonas sp. LL1]